MEGDAKICRLEKKNLNRVWRDERKVDAKRWRLKVCDVSEEILRGFISMKDRGPQDTRNRQRGGE